MSISPAISPSVTHSLEAPLFLSGPNLTELVNDVQLQSCSRNNFHVNLVNCLFSLEARRSSNVKGKLGKCRLDPVRLLSVRQFVLELYPLAGGESEDVAWWQCIKATDEASRRLNRGPKRGTTVKLGYFSLN